MTVRIDVAQLNSDLADELTPWLARVARWSQGIAKREAHVVVQKQTGRYVDGIEADVQSVPGGIGVGCVLRGLAEHSAVIEDGSKPHVITARNPSGRLKFRLNVTVNGQGQITGGTWRSPESVNHPGTKRTGLLQNAMLEALEANGATIFDRSILTRS